MLIFSILIVEMNVAEINVDIDMNSEAADTVKCWC